MQVELRHQPSFAVARCKLDPNETINVEAGAMYAQSIGITIESKMQGGFFGALKRSLLSGDSFFVSKFTAPKNGGWVDIAPSIPGDIFSLDITPNNPLTLTKGSWIGSELGVNLDTTVNPAMLFGGEGLFTVSCTGNGKVIGAAYGALDHHSLKEGEAMTVDTGHMVAYESSMRVNIRKAGTGLMNSWKSGEGLVIDIYGPGDVLTQSRNPSSFAAYLRTLMPSGS